MVFLTSGACQDKQQHNYLHSSVFDDATLVHLLPDPVDHKHNVRGLRGAVLWGGLLHVPSMEPRAAAGDWRGSEVWINHG